MVVGSNKKNQTAPVNPLLLHVYRHQQEKHQKGGEIVGEEVRQQSF